MSLFALLTADEIAVRMGATVILINTFFSAYSAYKAKILDKKIELARLTSAIDKWTLANQHKETQQAIQKVSDEVKERNEE